MSQYARGRGGSSPLAFAVLAGVFLPLVQGQICNNRHPKSGGLILPAFGHGKAMAILNGTEVENCEIDPQKTYSYIDGCVPAENDPQGLAVVYVLLLFWTFLGVGIVADLFMGAIEVITSKSRLVEFTDDDGKTKQVHIKTWNSTVANLTLMALGSSAPEILLSVLEIAGNGFFSGALGPGTIVGSAAFNLMCITGVLLVSVPKKNAATGETGIRKIDDLGVFGITAFSSVFAYLWLVIILLGTSPDVVDLPESVITFLFFPLLVLMAWMADKGVFTREADKKTGPKQEFITGIELSESQDPEQGNGNPANRRGSLIQFGNIQEADELVKKSRKRHVDPEKVAQALALQQIKQTPMSRAMHRKNATQQMMGRKALLPDVDEANATLEQLNADVEVDPKSAYVGFKTTAYHCLESSKKVVVKVERHGGEGEVTVAYKTVGGTATADEDFKSASGTLTFKNDEVQTITIEIVDDDETEDDETFTVELENPTNAKIHPEERVATVTIIDDDSPGTIQFAHTEVDGLAAEYRVKEECGSVLVKVSRVGGSAGTVSVNYATKEASATKDVDYMHVEGTLTFETGEVEKVIEVEIVDDDAFEKDEKFYINLSDPEGCSMGSISTAVVVIENDDEMSKLAEKVAFLLKLNLDRQKAAGADWKGQFTEAVEWPEGGGIAVVLHVLSLPWKILFAFTPPTRFLGGWLCFFVALVFIALVTALIGDLASLFGCSVGLQDSITAITFVALGTSLPDTFASKTAVVMDSNADNSIGNVTGSNSVNVFLGLGFPWLVAAIYWQNAGATPEWLERVGASGQAGAQVIANYPQGAFFVPAGDLTFSVIVFSVCAITTLGLLVFRRIKYGAELGGPMAYPHSMTCVFLWFLYITLSILNTTGAI